MYNAANYWEERRGGLLGLAPAEPDAHVDWPSLKQRREDFVSRLNGIYLRNLEKSGVDLVRGNARFVGDKALQVGEERVTVREALAAGTAGAAAAGLEPCVPELTLCAPHGGPNLALVPARPTTSSSRWGGSPSCRPCPGSSTRSPRTASSRWSISRSRWP